MSSIWSMPNSGMGAGGMPAQAAMPPVTVDPYGAAINAFAGVAAKVSGDPSVSSGGPFSVGGNTYTTFGGAKSKGASLDQNSIVVLAVAAVAALFIVKRRI